MRRKARRLFFAQDLRGKDYMGLAQAFGMAVCRIVKTRFDALDLCGERSEKSGLRRFDFAPGRGAFFLLKSCGAKIIILGLA